MWILRRNLTLSSARRMTSTRLASRALSEIDEVGKEIARLRHVVLQCRRM